MSKKSDIVEEKQERPRGVPRLRFPEFREEPGWEEQILSVASRIVTEKTPFGQIDAANYVNTERMLPDYSGVSTQSHLPSGGSITTFRALDILVSNIRPYLRKVWYSDKNGGASNDVIVFRANPNVNSAFLSYWLRNDRFIGHIMKGAKGVKMPRGDTSLMKEYPLAIPFEAEQKKIADCLSSLDNLIAAHNKKLDALRAYKKGLMQQLFPAEGETVPKLRFPEFRDAGEWEERSIAEMLQEAVRPLEMNDDEDYTLVTVRRRYGGITSRGVLKGSNILVKSQFLLRANDFLISKRQIVHNACGVVPKEFDGAIVSNEYSIFIQRPGCDVKFFNYFVQQPKVSQSFLRSSAGIVIEKMLFKQDQWLKTNFLFPSIGEQQKIAKYLSSIDTQIAAQTRKIEALKTHKRGLMQQLFPQTSEATP